MGGGLVIGQMSIKNQPPSNSFGNLIEEEEEGVVALLVLEEEGCRA